MSKYRLLEKIGAGGMGEVHKARQEALGRIVAVKFLNVRAGDEVFLKRFLREVKASSELQHPNVIKIFDFGELEGRPFYAMELIDGVTLKDLVEDNPREARKIADLILEQLLDALSFMHKKGFVHRDIKAANIMFDAAGHVTLMDFGLVKDEGNQATVLTEEGKILGTISYLSPEAFLGHPAAAPADIWAVGILYFYLLTGELPFDGDSPGDVMRAVLKDPVPDLRAYGIELDPPRLAFLEKMLHKSPEKRYSSGHAALRELRSIRKDSAPDDTGEDPGLEEAPVPGLPGETDSMAASTDHMATRRFAALAPPTVTPRSDASISISLERSLSSIWPVVTRPSGLFAALLLGGLSAFLLYAWRMPGRPGPGPASPVPAPATARALQEPSVPVPVTDTDPLEALKRTLFKFRARGVQWDMCEELIRIRKLKRNDRIGFALGEARKRWREETRKSLETSGLELAMERAHAYRDHHPDTPDSGYALYRGLTELELLNDTLVEIESGVSIPILPIFDQSMRPLPEDPPLPGKSHFVIFDPEDFKVDSKDRRLTTEPASLKHALNLWLKSGNPREEDIYNMGKKMENRSYVNDSPMDIRDPGPGEIVVVDLLLRFLSRGEQLEISFSSDKKQWTEPAVINGKDATRYHRYHQIPPRFVSGRHYFRIEYKFCDGLGHFGDCMIYAFGLHYLKG